MEFILESEYIELVKLLKILGMADTGGQSKQMISEGIVRLNGEPELRKRAKIRPGDVVETAGVTIHVLAASAT